MWTISSFPELVQICLTVALLVLMAAPLLRRFFIAVVGVRRTPAVSRTVRHS